MGSSYLASAARILSTLDTFSEKCCFLSVLRRLVSCGTLTMGEGWSKRLPGSSSDICLHSKYTILMDESVCLADQAHDFVPRTFCRRGQLLAIVYIHSHLMNCYIHEQMENKTKEKSQVLIHSRDQMQIFPY